MRKKRGGPLNSTTIVVVVAVLCVAGTGSSARAEPGNVTGSIVDLSTGRPLKGAEVMLSDLDRKVTTDASGTFSFADVPAGVYEVKASHNGYEPGTLLLEVLSGQIASGNLGLSSDGLLGDEVVVTGSKSPEKRLEAPVTIERLTSDDLSTAGGTLPLAALSGVKGLHYAEAGLLDKRVSARGFNSQFNSRMLTMLDGRLAVLPGTGLPQGASLPSTGLDVKAVEVVVGPASALYGPNAHTGVVNALTKTPWDDSGAAAVLRGGERSLVDGSARLAGRVGDLGWKLTGQYARADDFAPSREAPTHFYGRPTSPLVFEADLVDSYGSRVFKTEGSLYYRLRDWEFKGAYGYSSFDSVFITNTGRNQIRDWRIHNQVLQAVNSNWYAQVTRTASSAGKTYQIESLAPIVQANPSLLNDPQALEAARTAAAFVDLSELLDAELQYRTQLEKLKLTTGLQLRLYYPNSKGTYLSDATEPIFAREFGGYLQADYPLFESLRLVGAARLDTHNNYSAQLSPKAAVVYSVANNHHLRVGYNRAFKSPTILENYLLISGFLVGNRSGFVIRDAGGATIAEIAPLEPERVDALELGYKASIGRLFLDAVVHHSWYQQFISPLTARASPAKGTFAFYSDGRPVAEGLPTQGTLSTYSNFGRARVLGGDLGADFTLIQGLRLSAGISYLRLIGFENNDPSLTNLPLNVPELRTNGAIIVQGLGVKGLFGRLAGRHQPAYRFISGRWNSEIFYPDTGKVPDRFVADLSLGYRFSNGVTVGAHVFNMFNDRGVDVLGAAPGGRTGYLEVAYQMDGLVL